MAYATKYGGTAEIVERIGEVLRQAGLKTDVLPAKRAENVAAYKAVVLGSASYIGRWRKDVVKFLQANEKALTERKVWLFSSGPTGKGDPVELMKGQLFPDSQRSIIERIHPCGITVFHGVIDVKKIFSSPVDDQQS